MASNRIGRINEEIQRELASLIPNVKDPRVTGMISVTAVETTPDLRYAKVYISVLDKGDCAQVLKGLRSASGYLRGSWAGRSSCATPQSCPLSRTTPLSREPTSWSCSGTLRWSSRSTRTIPIRRTRHMTAKQAAEFLMARDNFLILTHLRPDGDTIGCAARPVPGSARVGKEAYVLENPEATSLFTPYLEGLLARSGYEPKTVISVDIAARSLFPDNAVKYVDRVDLAIDHHPSQEFFAHDTCLDEKKAACGRVDV